MSDAADRPHPRLTRLFLLSHAATAATMRAAFPDDEPIEAKGRASAVALAGRLPSVAQVLSSPAQAAQQTAAALAPTDTPAESFAVEAALRDVDYGRWAGQTLDERAAAEPPAVFDWLNNPDAAPHGGESLTQLVARVGAWLSDDPPPGGVLAVTHPAVMRAAVIHVLGAPPQAFWRLDIAPLSLFEFRRSGGPWSLRAMRLAQSST